MRVMLVLDHPYGAAACDNTPHRRAFTAALADAARRGLVRAGHEVDLVDLHADGFDPVMRADDLAAWRQGRVVDPLVANYQARLLQADHLILAFPIWWEIMPAMTKGFFDKVLTKGIIYSEPKPRRGFVSHLERLGGVTLMTVMATPSAVYRVVFGNPICKAVFRGTFHKMGIHRLTWLSHSDPAGRSASVRAGILASTERRFAAWRPVAAHAKAGADDDSGFPVA